LGWYYACKWVESLFFLSAGKGNKHVIQNNDEITLPTLENAGIINHKKIL
jgi:hypothetical protein